MFLVCSFSLLFFLTYCVCGLLSPGLKVEFFLPFGFFPPKIDPVVCVSFYRVRFVLSLLLLLFVCFPLMGKAE